MTDIADFYEAHKRDPYHRYELQDFVDNQKDSDMIDVSKGKLAKAARRLNDATPAEWDAVAKRRQKSAEWNAVAKEVKEKNDATLPYTLEELQELKDREEEVYAEDLALLLTDVKGEVDYAASFEDPIVQREFEDWMRMMSFGSLDEVEPLPKEKDVDHYVSGQHYNDVVPGMQYMEMMQYMLDGKSGVEAHLFGQVYKYLMRAGKKDDYEQDIRKARWYTNCLVKFVQTGKIDVENND